jgi:phospholipid transport system substrate-binding protein
MIKISLCLAFLSMLFGGVSLRAETGEHQREKLESTVKAALGVIYEDAFKELPFEAKQAKVRETIEASYDLNVIIRRAIGRNWDLMNEDEQDEVLELVKQLVIKAYVKGMEGKACPDISFGQARLISDKRMEIESTIDLDNKRYYVLYRLGRMSTGWQIYDIVAENISVVSNYRQQIDDRFRKGTPAELITRLNELLEKDTIDEDIQL